ncbi:MAG: Alpha-galactosidase [Chloroflexi bacterium]|nr:Alpha-galactosidase [Chloroflexota bacterium]
MILKTPFLQFTLDTKTAAWSLYSTQENAPYLDGVKMRLHYQTPRTWHGWRRKSAQALKTFKDPQITGPERVSSPHGDLQQLRLTLAPESCGLRSTLTFALAEEHPLFLWKISLENRGDRPVWIGKIEMLRAGFFPKKTFLPEAGPITLRRNIIPQGQGVVRPHPAPGELAFFSNGWQSWSHTGSYGADEIYRQTRLGFFGAPMWYNAGTPLPKKPGYLVSDMFGVLGDRQHRSGILAGYLSQKEHFGTLKARLDDPLYPALYLWANGDQTRLDPDARMTTDWAAVQFVDIDSPDPLAPYVEAVTRENGLSALTPALAKPRTASHRERESDSRLPSGEGRGVRAEARENTTGWCSWYDYYQDITAEEVRANLGAAQEIKESLPLDVIQIDDGYQAEVGDWLSFDPAFPEGVRPLADEIKEAGFRPGLWLAPFILHPKSDLAKEHRAWLLRNRWKLPVNAGFVWNAFTRALDITQPGALEGVQKVVRTAVEEWGFSFLKLDFLYAAALPGRYQDPTKTRAQVLRRGLEAIREAAGEEVTLLGCGAPLGPAIGLVDAMRIGADVHPSWTPSLGNHKALFRPEPNMPSVRNALQNTLTRAFLHCRWWLNDPDCLLLRPETDLTVDEIRAMATAIAFSGGLTMLSDDLTKLPPERLRIAQAILPPIGQRPRVVDWFDAPTPSLLRLDLENASGAWHLLAIFNWEKTEKDLELDLERVGLDEGGVYYAHSFWAEESARIAAGTLTLEAIPAHGVRVLALRPSKGQKPQYVGSNLHIAQGLEVADWSESGSRLKADLSRPGHVQGQVILSLPAPPRRASLNQKEIPWQKAEGTLYRFEVQFHGEGELEISY